MENLWNGLKHNRAFQVMSLLVLLLVLVAVFAPELTPYNPLRARMRDAFQAPSAAHWFGTDKLGRDCFSRILYGARYCYFGKVVDAIIMRIADMMIAFPGMILAIAVAGIMGASIQNAVIAIALVTWPKYARLARSMVLKIKKRDFVEAAIVCGGRPLHILISHILPNILPLMVITAASDIGAMMMELAGLSFLGFGSQPPAPEWGLMLNEGRQQFQSAPWLMAFPGLAIFITVVIFNRWGDALRDVLDPRQES